MVHLDTTILYIFSKVSQSTVQEGVGKLLEPEHREDWRTIVSCGDSWISALMEAVSVCTRHAQVQVSQHSNMEWRKEVLECPPLSGNNVQKKWLFREEESIFFKGVPPGNLVTIY